MRIGTITNLAYGLTLLFTAVSGGAFIQAQRAAEAERVSIAQKAAIERSIDALEVAAELRSDEARLFAMRGDARHLALFRNDEAAAAQRERVLNALKAHGLTTAEQATLSAAERNADMLDVFERDAVAQARRGDVTTARARLFGSGHERLQTALLDAVGKVEALIDARTASQVAAAQARSDWLNGLARIMLAATAALFLAVLYFVLRRRVALPLMQMTGIVTRLAQQDYSVEVPHDPRQDEIGDMRQAIEVFRSNGLERDRLEAQRRADQQVKDMILQLMHRLQAVQTEDELAQVVARFAPRIFPTLAGHLYVLSGSRTSLIQASSWQDPISATQSFAVNACWGLRRSRPHWSHASSEDIPCQHVAQVSVATLCVPLAAQGDAIGLLYLEQREGATPLPEPARLYVELLAENIGLALANLRLQRQLTSFAVRDPLTGLLNRRCLDETLSRAASDHGAQPCACLMIDIDHFKRFNDQFGHDAGDHVMQHVAAILSEAVSDQGQAYRYGGEEFTLLAPLDRAAALTLAEMVRARIEAAPLAHRGRSLGQISVSIGVAAAPEDGPVVNVVTQADAALLEAKRRGRNCVLAVTQIAPAPAAQRKRA